MTPNQKHPAVLLALTLAASVASASDGSTVRLDERTPYFRLESQRSVGDRGEVSLDVSIEPACGVQWRFDHAELEVQRNRFGDVQFVSLPVSGCVECQPVVVRWMHEPTGQLAFHVNVYRARVEAPCSEGE